MQGRLQGPHQVLPSDTLRSIVNIACVFVGIAIVTARGYAVVGIESSSGKLPGCAVQNIVYENPVAPGFLRQGNG